jgi:hypothetical protein
MSHIQAYPLQWPEGWPRTKVRRAASFDTRFIDARDGLLNEVRLMGGRQPVISSNVPLRMDGLPRANFTRDPDPGVAVYFALQSEPRVFACDRWTHVEDNLQAIRKTIEALEAARLEAQSNEALIASLGGDPARLIDFRMIDVLGEANVIYIPTEAGMPLLEAGRLRTE